VNPRVFFVDLCVTINCKLHKVPQRRHEVPRRTFETFSGQTDGAIVGVAQEAIATVKPIQNPAKFA